MKIQVKLWIGGAIFLFNLIWDYLWIVFFMYSLISKAKICFYHLFFFKCRKLVCGQHWWRSLQAARRPRPLPRPTSQRALRSSEALLVALSGHPSDDIMSYASVLLIIMILYYKHWKAWDRFVERYRFTYFNLILWSNISLGLCIILM